MKNFLRTIHVLALVALLSLPIAASAEDSVLMQGYCGPNPPNTWFQFSSSTVSAVQSQLISTLTARAVSSYDVAVAEYLADLSRRTGCAGQVTPRPTSYCTSPVDCTAQIDGLVQITCNGQSSPPFWNSFIIKRGGCTTAIAPAPRKVVVIDPGHGFTCAAHQMSIGAVGVTDFPSNDPPSGRLREDELTMAIAREVQRILPTSKYRVVLTKGNANECPSFEKRGQKVRRENAEAFVSVHINKALVVPVIDVPLPVAHGTSVLRNSATAQSLNLAVSMARAVSSSLGVNNRGVMINDSLAVLKPEITRTPNAVLVEAARLSGTDEKILHTSGSATRVANGIKAALDQLFGN